MSKTYKYYDEEAMKEYRLYFEDSLNMISKKFYSYRPEGNTITIDEYSTIKTLLEQLTLASKDIGNTSSLLKVKLFNKKLREYYGLKPLYSTEEYKQNKE